MYTKIPRSLLVQPSGAQLVQYCSTCIPDDCTSIASDDSDDKINH